MTRNKTAFTLIVLVALLSLSTAAVAPALKFTFKDVNAPGATETDTYAINASGVITGDYVDSAGAQHGMILKGTKLTTVDNKSCVTTPGSGVTDGIQFYGINSAGVIAGWCGTTSGTTIGFTYAKGKFTNINIKGASVVQANGINDKGNVVGDYVDSAGDEHGFLLVGKKLTTLNLQGATYTEAWGIDNAGGITIFQAAAAGGLCPCVSYLLKGKKLTSISYPGAGSDGTGVHTPNNKGDIDGTYFDSSALRHGFLLHGGKYYSFDDPNGVGQSRADGLNDTLGIVGRYTDSASVTHGFFAQAK